MASLPQGDKLEDDLALFLSVSTGSSQIKQVRSLLYVKEGQNLVVLLEGEDKCAAILENIHIAKRASETLLLTPDRILIAAYHAYFNQLGHEYAYIGTFPKGFRVQYKLRRSDLRERKIFVYRS